MGTPRVRTLGSGFSNVQVPYVYTQYKCDGALDSTSTTYQTMVSGEEKVTTDVVTSNFNALSRSGAIINNPFSSVTTTKQGTYGGSCVAVRTGTCTNPGRFVQTGLSTADSSNILPHPSHATDLISARVVAGTAAYAGIAEPDWSGLVELAQIKQTSMIARDASDLLLKFIQDLRNSKKFRKSRIKTIGGFIANSYLTYRYAFLTTVMSLNDLLDAIDSLEAAKPVRYTSRGKSPLPTRITEVVEADAALDTYQWQYRTARSEIGGKVRAGVLYEHRHSYDTFGLNVTQIPIAAWEIIPYSFVVDWFVNVSDFISALVPKAGVHVLSSWTTVETELKQTRDRRLTARTPTGWSVSCDRWATAETRVLTKRRDPGASVGLATKFHEISFEKPKDFRHLADGLALIVQQLAT